MPTTALRRSLALVALVATAGTLVSLLSPIAFAQDNGRTRPCGNGTLQGDWAVTVSGVRVAGPAGPDTFISLAIRTYDGSGRFTETARSHGTATGATITRISGTYSVQPDCTGTAQFLPPGAPAPVESAFIVIDRLNEIHEIVLSPQPNMVTAVQRRLN